ncbi:hypothetical protein BDN70DRAFT_546531 [Pholiota conissans]|uniref:Uncharacterized protein n=1 Tax=Pholiota conissans TaxID=109636 RepID=A0A9P6CTL5_9AGAR|nr:hypothetical protein BDN70DRAFT_546531 [Pholiota conissans]
MSSCGQHLCFLLAGRSAEYNHLINSFLSARTVKNRESTTPTMDFEEYHQVHGISGRLDTAVCVAEVLTELRSTWSARYLYVSWAYSRFVTGFQMKKEEWKLQSSGQLSL